MHILFSLCDNLGMQLNDIMLVVFSMWFMMDLPEDDQLYDSVKWIINGQSERESPRH